MGPKNAITIFLYKPSSNNFVQPVHWIFQNHVSDFVTCERFRVYIPIMDPPLASHTISTFT